MFFLNNFMKKSKLFFLKYFYYILAFSTYLYIIVFTFLHNRKNDGYVLGDWLINYQDGGFKRRGISGSLFFFLQDFSGLNLNILVFSFQFIVISLFFFFFIKLVRNKKITLLYLSLLLSPLGFIAYFNCVDYVGKKEFILFLLFTYFTYLLNYSKLSLRKEYLVAFLLFIAVLFHEVVLFYIPYFIILLILKTEKLEPKRYLKYLLAVFMPAILIIAFGNNINEGNSLEILKQRGVIITNGIFFWNIDEREYILSQIRDYMLYPISFLISFFHIKFYLKEEFRNWKIIGLYFLLAFLFSLPLFVLAIDWGRWIYIHMMMIIITLSAMLNEESYKEEDPLYTKKNIFIFIFIIFSLIYRVEMSGKGFTFEGFLYRIIMIPGELINKML